VRQKNKKKLLHMLKVYKKVNIPLISLHCIKRLHLTILLDSPAEWAGLQENDQILVFGTADATNHRNLEAIKEIVAHNIGSVIRIVVRRKNRPDAKDKWLLCDLQLTPQQWKGRGMLGCVIMPFEEITSEEP
jgi:hypothetical protein